GRWCRRHATLECQQVAKNPKNPGQCAVSPLSNAAIESVQGAFDSSGRLLYGPGRFEPLHCSENGVQSSGQRVGLASGNARAKAGVAGFWKMRRGAPDIKAR